MTVPSYPIRAAEDLQTKQFLWISVSCRRVRTARTSSRSRKPKTDSQHQTLLSTNRVNKAYPHPSAKASGFGGLVVSMLASGTQVCGVFFGRKNPQYAFLRKGSKPFVPCRRFAARKRTLFDYVEVGSQAKLVGHFSLEVPSFSNRGIRDRAAWGSIEGSTLEQHGHPWS
jgi:hypothetical protein